MLNKSIFYVSLLLFILSGCTEEGESLTKKYDGDENTETSITHTLIEVASDSVVDSVLEDTLNSAETTELVKTTKDAFSQIVNEFYRIEGVQPTDNIYFTVDYLSAYDGDTADFKVNEAYRINDDNSITEVNLKEFGFSTGQKIRIRSLLIDTPEIKGKDNGGNPQPFAEEARNYARKILKDAKSIVVTYDKGDKQDPYSRQLMYIWCDGKLISSKLLEKGLAKVAYVHEENTTYLKVYQSAEQKAIDKQLGIWSIQ